MRNKLFSILGVALFTAVIWSPGAVFAAADKDDIAQVTVEGYGAIYGDNISSARDKAIEDALRRAVEQAVGTVVSSETMTKNFQMVKDEILTQSKGYVKKWNKLSEKKKGGELIVKISAKVSMAKIMDSDGMGNLIRRMGKPKVMVLLGEQNIGDATPKVWWDKAGAKKGGGATITSTDLSISENTLIDTMKNFGFDFVDRQALAGKMSVSSPMKLIEDDKAIKSIANQTDAQVVIVGKAVATNAGKVPDTQFYSGQANMSIRALKTDTGEIIATVTKSGGFPHISPQTAGNKALGKVAKKSANVLVQKILKAWSKEAGGARNLHLSIKGIGGYSNLKKFKSWVRKYMRGVKAVNNVKLQSGRGEMDLDFAGGDANSLADEIVAKKFNGKEIDVVDLTPNKLVVIIK